VVFLLGIDMFASCLLLVCYYAIANFRVRDAVLQKTLRPPNSAPFIIENSRMSGDGRSIVLGQPPPNHRGQLHSGSMAHTEETNMITTRATFRTNEEITWLQGWQAA
jgi:hypothetical protein